MANLEAFIEDNLDIPCMEIIDGNINMCVPWYLMAAYAYYIEDDPILSDDWFDRLAKKMLEHWEEIDHIHKDKIEIDDLKAGTFLGEYPSRVKDGLESLRSAYYGKDAARRNH